MLAQNSNHHKLTTFASLKTFSVFANIDETRIDQRTRFSGAHLCGYTILILRAGRAMVGAFCVLVVWWLRAVFLVGDDDNGTRRAHKNAV